MFNSFKLNRVLKREIKRRDKEIKRFKKLYSEYGNCPFNLYLHTHPVNEKNDYKNKYNVHIHIVPRKFNFGGFELSTGVYISSESSEDIAKRLKFD